MRNKTSYFFFHLEASHGKIRKQLGCVLLATQIPSLAARAGRQRTAEPPRERWKPFGVSPVLGLLIHEHPGATASVGCSR